MEYLIIICLLVIALESYLLYVFFIKNKKALEILRLQDQFLLDIKQDIKDTSEKLQEVDSKGFFKTDDEVGFFFDYIKEMQQNLEKYDIN